MLKLLMKNNGVGARCEITSGEYQRNSRMKNHLSSLANIIKTYVRGFSDTDLHEVSNGLVVLSSNDGVKISVKEAIRNVFFFIPHLQN